MKDANPQNSIGEPGGEDIADMTESSVDSSPKNGTKGTMDVSGGIFGSNAGSSTNMASFESASNIETEFPTAYTGSNGSNDEFGMYNPQDTIDYTNALKSIYAALGNIQEILKLDVETAASNVEATGQVAEVVGNLGKSDKSSPKSPRAVSYTDIKNRNLES